MSRAHGERRTYVAGCRCAPCTRANRIALRAYRARAATNVRSHGTSAAYGRGCRCHECRAAWARWFKLYRERTFRTIKKEAV